MSEFGSRRGARTAVLAVGVLLVVSQAAVLIGWGVFSSWFTGLLRALGPLSHHAVLGFAAAGAGLIAGALRRHRLLAAAGLLTATAGVLGLGAQLGLPSRWAWLWTAWAADGVAVGGRPASAVSLSLLLAGTALLLAGLEPGSPRRTPFRALAGAVVAAIGAAALLAAYGGLAGAEHAETLPTGGLAAAASLVLGLGLIAADWRGGHAPALLAGAGVLAATLYLSNALHTVERAELRRHIELAVIRACGDIAAAVDSRLAVLDRMARRWEVRGSMTRAEWEADAALYLRDILGFRALAWMDAGLVTRWAAHDGGPVLEWRALAARPEVLAALQAARRRHTVVLSAPLRLADAQVVAVAAAPLAPAGRFDGYLLAVIGYHELLDAVLARSAAAGFVIAAGDAGRQVYLSSAEWGGSDPDWTMQSAADVGGRRWEVRVWPRPGWVTTRRLALPAVVIVLGTAIASLLSLSLYWAEAARRRARQAEAANRELEREVAERKQAQKELAQARDLLEVRVSERTAELAQANAALRAEIAERLRAEEILRASEERYRNLFESANDIVYTHDLQGNFTSLNRAGERITGYTREEVLRMNMADIVAPEHSELARQMIARKLGGEGPSTYELTILTRDGRRLIVEISSHLMFENGKPAGALGIAREVTERKRLEEQLRQSQKIEAIGRLAGGIAHDFNNLLTIIGAYSHMLLTDLPEDQPARGYANEILAAAERASALTDRLLAFSRRQVIQPVLVDLNELIRNILGLLRRMVGQDIELSVVLAEELGEIRADPTQLEQVIMNLVINSRDAMPAGGKLVLETANLDLEHGRPGGPRAGRWVVLRVRDTGHGMDAEVQSHLFEPFFTTKGPGKGTGLGLSIVYGIVKQSGGEIAVQSAPGQGATFTIYFPRAEHAVLRPAAPAEEDLAPGGGETVLLVEDEPGVRKLVRQMLAQQGYQVLEAAGGADSLALVERYPGRIDVLLTDVVMPQMNGRELAERLTALRPGLKVMYMTGYTEDAVVREGISSADVVCLQKPFLPETLARKVREVLDRRG